MERLPAWLRPAVVGALLLIGVVGIRAVFVVATGTPGVSAWALLQAALFAGLGGAAGGLAFSLLGRPAMGIPFIGSYLMGLVTVGAYMGALALVAPYAFDEPIVKPGSSWMPFVVITALFGLVMGHAARDR